MVLVKQQICPTCFKVSSLEDDFMMSLEDKTAHIEGEYMVVHQCEKCRERGDIPDPDQLKEVLEGRRLPIHDITENYSLSDLIKDLLGSNN